MITQNSQRCFILLKKRSQLKEGRGWGQGAELALSPSVLLFASSRGLRKCPSRFMI